MQQTTRESACIAGRSEKTRGVIASVLSGIPESIGIKVLYNFV
jgi:hypothetical protein